MSNPVKLPLKVGDSHTFIKTLSESDVYLFAGITGDFSQMHTNEQFMKNTMYKTRIAHGMLSFAVGCTASTLLQVAVNSPIPSVSYGYERVRFIKPVFFGDTLTCVYTITEVDEESLKTYGTLEVFNQHDQICVAATHILKFFPLDSDEA